MPSRDFTLADAQTDKLLLAAPADEFWMLVDRITIAADVAVDMKVFLDGTDDATHRLFSLEESNGISIHFRNPLMVDSLSFTGGAAGENVTVQIEYEMSGGFAYGPDEERYAILSDPTVQPGGQSAPGVSGGIDFRAEEDIYITELGRWDTDLDGLNDAETVRVSRISDQALLGSVVIPSGVGPDLLYEHRWVRLDTPIFVPKGTEFTVWTYIVNAADWNGNSNQGDAVSVFDGAPYVSNIGECRYAVGDTFPTIPNGSPAAGFHVTSFRFKRA
jgi:hypothetical protein